MDSMNRSRTSTTLSLLLHGLLIFLLIYVKNTHILVPSRSDGVQISLISNEDLPKPVIIPKAVIANTPVDVVKTLNTPADINLKDAVKPKIRKMPMPAPTPTPKVIPPKVVKAQPTIVPTAKKLVMPKAPKPKVKPNAAINDLLNDLEPSAQNTGTSKAVATGGSSFGSSDTKNLANNYADLVINQVRPYVIIPDGVDSSVVATVDVTLLPNMQVYRVTLVHSSGNSDYDNNVIQAINRVKTFPSLPDGAVFSDYRKLRLLFHPQ